MESELLKSNIKITSFCKVEGLQSKSMQLLPAQAISPEAHAADLNFLGVHSSSKLFGKDEESDKADTWKDSGEFRVSN